MKLRRSNESGCLRRVRDTSVAKFFFCLAALATGLLSNGGPAQGGPPPLVRACGLLGCDREGNLFVIDLPTGAGTLVGPLPTEATEIECGEGFVPDCFVQQVPTVNREITPFDIKNAATLGPSVPTPGVVWAALEYVGGVLYGTSITRGGGGAPSTLQTLDPLTGVATAIGLTGVGPIPGLAYDVGSGVMYGIAGSREVSDFYTINLSTGVATVVGTTTMQAGSLQFGPDGNLYAGGTGDISPGELHQIDPATGASTLVGHTGFGRVTGLTTRFCDLCDLFGSDKDGNLFVLDLLTGAGTLIGLLPTDATEIECDQTLDPDCFVQNPNGGLAITPFDITNAAGLGPTVGDGGSFTGLEYVGGVLYGTYILGGGGMTPSTLATLDPLTGVATDIGLTGVGPIPGLAYDVASGVMYGIAGGIGLSDFYTINLSTGVATVVGTTTMQAGSLQFGPDGNLYAGGTGDISPGELHQIDPATGASTLVGSTGFGRVTGLTTALCTRHLPGDCNQDGGVDLSDGVAFLGWLFNGVQLPAPPGSELCLLDPVNATAVGLQIMDWNGDGALDNSDGVGLLTWSFSGAAEHVLGQDCIHIRSPDCISSCQ